MLTPKEREIYQALAAGNMSLAACIWSSWREKQAAYTQNKTPDPFQQIFDCAKRVLEADDIRLSVQGKPFTNPIESDFDKKKEA